MYIQPSGSIIYDHLMRFRKVITSLMGGNPTGVLSQEHRTRDKIETYTTLWEILQEDNSLGRADVARRNGSTEPSMRLGKIPLIQGSRISGYYKTLGEILNGANLNYDPSRPDGETGYREVGVIGDKVEVKVRVRDTFHYEAVSIGYESEQDEINAAIVELLKPDNNKKKLVMVEPSQTVKQRKRRKKREKEFA